MSFLGSLVSRRQILGRLLSGVAGAALALPGVLRLVRLPAYAGSTAGFAVVGKTTWHARQGAQAVDVEWQQRPAGALDTRWAAGIPLVSAVADAASSHWTEFRRIGTLGALFVLGGAAYLGVLYGFGFRLRDVKR